MAGDSSPPIVVRKIKRSVGGHHGGAWKVAYADFVTAMMAFFLVMWLIGAGTRQQRAAIADYFKNPSMTPGTATVAPPGKLGKGGPSDALIQLGGSMEIPHGPGEERRGSEDAERQARAQERKQLDELMEQLHQAIDKSQALAPYKDQLLLDITPEGLRIQIVDKQNRPMFDTGSAQLKPYTVAILHVLAGFINRVPNRISISGHTDDAPYGAADHYTNWELSADRANAARRALVEGGLQAGKTALVVGLADAVPFDKAHPGAAVNRRISIIVMTKQAEHDALLQDLAGWNKDDPGHSSNDRAAVHATRAVPAGPVALPATGHVSVSAGGVLSAGVHA